MLRHHHAAQQSAQQRQCAHLRASKGIASSSHAYRSSSKQCNASERALASSACSRNPPTAEHSLTRREHLALLASIPSFTFLTTKPAVAEDLAKAVLPSPAAAEPGPGSPLAEAPSPAAETTTAADATEAPVAEASDATADRLAAAEPSAEAAPVPSAASAQPSPPPSPAAGVAEAIRADFVDRQYYVTGNLSLDLYDKDCVFKDPTVTVKGAAPYARAVATLFDPATSRADLLSLSVTAPDTLVLRWRLEGRLRLGGLAIKPYTGTTVYGLGADGKIVRHEETWDISTLDAFLSVLLPGFGAPPAAPVPAAPVPAAP